MPYPFLKMLQHLRREEEILLFGLLLDIPKEEEQKATAFLSAAYETESLDYPFAPPPFEASAALWGAATLHTAAQLLLYRQHEVSDLGRLAPPYTGVIDAAAILSADLTLRFLPDILYQLKKIDPEDELIGILERHLQAWHYSGVRYPLPAEELDFMPIAANKCLLQLYIDRVIDCKRTALARHPALQEGVRESMGLHSSIFWNEFNREI